MAWKDIKAPWIVRLLWDPVETLDLVDSDGRPDHGKVLPAILLFSAILYQYLAIPYAIGALVVLGSLAYGYGAWRAFLKSKSVTGTFSEETKSEKVEVDIHQEITERILKNRDSEAGIDPTDD
jgi:hypothetical protein